MHKTEKTFLSPVPLHGGRLNEAIQRYGIAREQWLDLSTGINPNGWPVPALPPEVFSRLPEEDDGLQAVAADYYGSPNLLLVPGSQMAIQALPELRHELFGPARVGVLSPAYAEHAFRWQQAGHQVLPLAEAQIEAVLSELDVLVLINPCNPSGVTFDRKCLLRWHAALAARGGWLLVDEAFVDATPELSLITDSMPEGLIVLRSLGKFFGLAGIRVGAVCARHTVLEYLSRYMGPWAISHPARVIARQALSDRCWQQCMRERLALQGSRLHTLLKECFGGQVHGTALFAGLVTEQAEVIEHACARRGILIRRFEQPAALRFGLPGNEAEWQRLEQVLSEIRYD